MFHVGQQVVCIEDRYWNPWVGDMSPVKGRVYTIREILIDAICRVGLRFEEIINAPHIYIDGQAERAFLGDRFRPVRKTNIDVFTAMLAPADGSKVAA